MDDVVIVVDLETTGLSAKADAIIEVAAVPLINDEVRIDCAFHTLVDPRVPLKKEAMAVNGITEDMVRGKPTIDVVLPELKRFCQGYGGDHILVAHNASFDRGFIVENALRMGITGWPPQFRCTKLMAQKLLSQLYRHRLDDLCRHFQITIPEKDRHRAVADAAGAAMVYKELRRLEGWKPAQDALPPPPPAQPPEAPPRANNVNLDF